MVDVSDFGGTVREYQVRVDPNKLVSYGMSIGQVEQQLANNNINAGGSFVETGLQQMNVRTLGLFHDVAGHRADGAEDAKRDRSSRQGHRRRGAGPQNPAGTHGPGQPYARTARIVDEPDVIQGVVLMRKGADAGPTLEAIHKKVDRTQQRHPASPA